MNSLDESFDQIMTTEVLDKAFRSFLIKEDTTKKSTDNLTIAAKIKIHNPVITSDIEIQRTLKRLLSSVRMGIIINLKGKKFVASVPLAQEVKNQVEVVKSVESSNKCLRVEYITVEDGKYVVVCMFLGIHVQ